MKPLLFLLIVVLGAGLWNSFATSNQIKKLDARVDGLSRSPMLITSGDATSALDALRSSVEVEPLEYRSFDELKKKLQVHLKDGSIRDFAQACAEVDLWSFPPESERPAGDVIEKFLELLRQRIIEQVNQLDSKALAAEKGEDAERLFAEASALIQLYPVPALDASKQKFESELRRRSEISRRIGEIRHLRYNQWAISQIEKGYQMFHENLRTFDDEEEDQNLVNTTGAALSSIDPGLLTPSAVELYMGLLRQTYEQVSESHRSSLAKALNNPDLAKKPLSDF